MYSPEKNYEAGDLEADFHTETLIPEENISAEDYTRLGEVHRLLKEIVYQEDSLDVDPDEAIGARINAINDILRDYEQDGRELGFACPHGSIVVEDLFCPDFSDEFRDHKVGTGRLVSFQPKGHKSKPLYGTNLIVEDDIRNKYKIDAVEFAKSLMTGPNNEPKKVILVLSEVENG